MEKRIFWTISSFLMVMSMLLAGCSPLQKGWSQFGSGKYEAAIAEWQQEEKEDLSVPIAQANAALAMVDSYEQAIAAKEAGNDQAMVEHSLAVVSYQNKWEDKTWIDKSSSLRKQVDESGMMIEEGNIRILTQLMAKAQTVKKKRQHLKMLRYTTAMAEQENEASKPYFDRNPELRKLGDEALALNEEAYYLVMRDYAKEDYWVNVIKEYKAYVKFTKQHNLQVSNRNRKMKAQADVELKKRKKLLAEFDKNLECAKQNFMEEAYKDAMVCINKADAYVKKYKRVRFNTDDLDYVRDSTEQAIEIQRQIEAEKARMAEEERKRIEEENRRIAAEELRKERERQQTERAKIRLARAAERQRLMKLAEERRKEAERQRKIEERNRRWRAFLAKGAPLKPLVTTVLRPSEGIGTLAKGKKQKWQGGSQLPRPKDKTIKSEDVYALEVEVPKSHKLTYLRNYYKKTTRERNMLKSPKTQGGKRSYYTENFKGGRYYIEVQNQKSTDKKYEIKARIYKIPVTF
jgi:hypothetical protein